MKTEELEYLFENTDDYLFDEALLRHMQNALRHLPFSDGEAILGRTLFLCYENGEGSWQLPAAYIRGRNVVILDPDDLKTPEAVTITILHEAAHSFLGHNKSGRTQTKDEYERQEDEAWAKVRDWLPPSLHGQIDRAEAMGGGTSGQLNPEPE